MEQSLELLVKAKANVIEMVSYEDKRIQGFVNHIAKKLGMNWYVWNEVNGLILELKNLNRKKIFRIILIFLISLRKPWKKMRCWYFKIFTIY